MKEEPLKLKKQNEEVASRITAAASEEAPGEAYAPRIDLFGLEYFLVNALGVLVLLNGIFGIAVYAWQMYARAKGAGVFSAVLLYGADVYLAFGLLRRKPWIRKALLVRAAIGLFMLFAVAVVFDQFTEAAEQTIFWAALLILLSGRVERFQARLLSFATFAFLLYTNYMTFDALFFRQNVVEQVSGATDRAYFSERYHFRITVPSNWIIVSKHDFNKVQRTFAQMKSEVAFVTSDEKSYCAVIPEDLENFAYGYDAEYKLEALRKNFLQDLQDMEQVQILSNKSDYLYGDGGFELKWTVTKEGVIYKYLLLYGIYGQTGIQMLCWTQEIDSAAVFEDVRDILRNIEIR